MHSVSGLIILKKPFTEEGEYFWIKKCLSDYPSYPNKCNLHSHNLLHPNENWWDVCHKYIFFIFICKLIVFLEKNKETSFIWERFIFFLLFRDAKRGLEIFNKLRWVTFGYHHDWDHKVNNSCNFKTYYLPKIIENLL